jgi:hypothetical protein
MAIFFAEILKPKILWGIVILEVVAFYNIVSIFLT